MRLRLVQVRPRIAVKNENKFHRFIRQFFSHALLLGFRINEFDPECRFTRFFTTDPQAVFEFLLAQSLRSYKGTSKNTDFEAGVQVKSGVY